MTAALCSPKLTFKGFVFLLLFPRLAYASISLLRTISLSLSLERHVFAGRQRVILKYNMDLSLRFKIDATWRAEGKGTGEEEGGGETRGREERKREEKRSSVVVISPLYADLGSFLKTHPRLAAQGLSPSVCCSLSQPHRRHQGNPPQKA